MRVKRHRYKKLNNYTVIDLKEIYPSAYQKPIFVLIKKEIASCLRECNQLDEALERKDRYYGLFYLGEFTEHFPDPSPSVEVQVISKSMLPERKRILFEAIQQLSEKQLKRVVARYYLEISNSEIAALEGVDESSIRKSIKK